MKLSEYKEKIKGCRYWVALNSDNKFLFLIQPGCTGNELQRLRRKGIKTVPVSKENYDRFFNLITSHFGER